VSDQNFANYKDDFPDRWVNQPAAIFQSMYIPYYLKAHWTGKEGELRRQAISMSINRKQITDKIFNGTRTPAKDFTSPVIAGYSDSLKGSSVLDYNKSKAKELWAEADKISPYGDETFTIAYNADGGHEAWVTAVANSISNTLGIKAEGAPAATFQEALDAQEGHKLTGASRSGWQADYPSLYNFLAPLYQTGAGSNYGEYSSADFDKLLKEGAAADTTEAANKKFQEAQELLFKELPAIPLWYSNETGVWSDTVSNVKFGWNSVPLYYAVTKSAS
jgi:oligopeptide transport system substrate-binding protein